MNKEVEWVEIRSEINQYVIQLVFVLVNGHSNVAGFKQFLLCFRDLENIIIGINFDGLNTRTQHFWGELMWVVLLSVH